jgi:arginine-tRNA-protein transferase
MADGLSLVYSFFAPERNDSSPGSAIILWHIDWARSLGLPFVYLGYWIADSPKMAYKIRFEPLEVLGREGWERR